MNSSYNTLLIPDKLFGRVNVGITKNLQHTNYKMYSKQNKVIQVGEFNNSHWHKLKSALWEIGFVAPC